MIGLIAARNYGRQLPICVVDVAEGYAIGTRVCRGGPRYTVESEQRFRNEDEAKKALRAGKWTQCFE